MIIKKHCPTSVAQTMKQQHEQGLVSSLKNYLIIPHKLIKTSVALQRRG